MNTWTKETIHQLVAEQMGSRKLIVVSNREPYIHMREGSNIRCITPASGLTMALDPVLRACSGVWVAHGSGNADREIVDRFDRVPVPPGSPAYTLRRVWLTQDIEKEYYYGLANEGLWPLCHIVFHRPRFSLKHWTSYRRANEIFAEAVLEEADGDAAFVFVQDYHLALMPRILRTRNPNLRTAQFWHIPWPNRETFRVFPWKEELLDGLLGNDLLGFHVRYHCDNFLETIERVIESRVDREHGTVTRAGHVTTVRPFPISIDFAQHEEYAAKAAAEGPAERWKEDFASVPEILGIGIDRIDYTKGIPDRLHALDRLFENHPEYLGRLVFIQIGAPSRTAIADYAVLNTELSRVVDEINRKWARKSWTPIVFVRRHVDRESLIALHLMADFCVVSSLHDGMNLVAKEFVASRFDGDGVLILSAFTGAARELRDALIINPFFVEELSNAMHSAIIMPAEERRGRMNHMRAAVSENNIYRWAGKIVQTLCGLEDGDSWTKGAVPMQQFSGISVA